MAGTLLVLDPARRGDAMALHTQISNQLRAAIGSGTLHEGDQLPPEAQLASQVHVARLTVRQALDNLAREGIIERRHGVGTFVAAHAARTEDLARSAYNHAEVANLAAAQVKAEAAKLRLEAKRLRAEMATLRQELAHLLGGVRPDRATAVPLPPQRRARLHARYAGRTVSRSWRRTRHTGSAAG